MHFSRATGGGREITYGLRIAAVVPLSGLTGASAASRSPVLGGHKRTLAWLGPELVEYLEQDLADAVVCYERAGLRGAGG
jgi:hypothetical protein